MARVDIYDLIKKRYNPNFDFDNLRGIPLGCLFSRDDIRYINEAVNSVKLTSKTQEKYNLIDEIMSHRHFVKMSSGTNRVCYKYLEDQRIVVKVAFRRTGLKDNRNELINQTYLKPYICKCFESTTCGTIAEFEKVEPITNEIEFKYIAEDIFDLINKKIDGRYILEDIGTKSFLNYGIRKGFGPVILDYAYVYEVDGNKLFCNAPDMNNPYMPCGGEIDFDVGFNEIRCTKCGKKYFGNELAKVYKENEQIISKKGERKMIVTVQRGNEVINEKRYGADLAQSDFYDGEKRTYSPNRRKSNHHKSNRNTQTISHPDRRAKNNDENPNKFSQSYNENAVKKAISEVENIPQKFLDNDSHNEEYVTSHVESNINDRTIYSETVDTDDSDKYNSNVSIEDSPTIDNDTIIPDTQKTIVKFVEGEKETVSENESDINEVKNEEIPNTVNIGDINDFFNSENENDNNKSLVARYI